MRSFSLPGFSLYNERKDLSIMPEEIMEGEGR
jgi:hypothetical protein